MVVNIKGLYGNLGYRFKKISIRRDALPYLHGVLACFLHGYIFLILCDFSDFFHS